MNRINPCCQKCVELDRRFPVGTRVQRVGDILGRFRWGQVLDVKHLPDREPQLEVMWHEPSRLEYPHAVEKS